MNKNRSSLDNHRVQRPTSYIFSEAASRRRHLTEKKIEKTINSSQKKPDAKGLIFISIFKD